MDDKKTTLYLALLCIILVIWGSVLDGKRMHTKKVLEAENAELLSLVDATRTSFNEAKVRQAELTRKLKQVQQQLAELKARNEELKAALEEAKRLRAEAEARAAEAEAKAGDCDKAAGNAVSQAPAAPAPLAPAYDARIKMLENKLDQLIRERDELRSSRQRDREESFANSLAVSELESQLRFCREQVRQYQEGARETAALKSRVRELEWELSSRTQELWNTRLNLSADLDACTRRLMEASNQKVIAPPPPPPPQPPCAVKIKNAGQGNCKGKKDCSSCMGCNKCKDCPKLKQLQEKLQAYSTRVEALQQQLYNANLQSLKEIEELKRALKEQNEECIKQLGGAESAAVSGQAKDEKIEELSQALAQKEKELDELTSELEQYKKNTAVLLEQIRQQRAEIKRLKAGK